MHAMTERGRFAPSPTGELHLGNARTAILAWLWARSEGGGFTLRVEDLDRPRVRPGLAGRQLEELAWLGLTWDEGPDPRTGHDLGGRGPYRQSERTVLYEAALARLGDQVYECFCSRAEIASASAPHGPQDDGPRYPGTCAHLRAAQRAERRRTRAPALRLRVPPGPIAFHDELQGPQEFDPQAAVGDFVLRRADGIFAYQLAVVVDDAAMAITQVLRGDDLLPSTARQILLYRLLGLRQPRWAHAGLVAGTSGERLSKRDRAASLSALRAADRDPGEVVARLCALSGLPELPGRALADRVSTFALDRVLHGMVRLDRA
jgi:glutamyl-tRNA synthetase